MSDKSPKKTGNKSGSDLETELKQPNKSRRSFAKAGIMAPVMMSLINRPAWGNSVRCTVSGFGSLATIGSGVMPSEATCNYDSSDVFVGTECGTGGEGNTKKLSDSDVFGSCVDVDSADNATLCEILNTPTRRWDKLMVTAWYNERAGNSPFGSTFNSTTVEDVYCAFYNNDGAVYGFGGVMMNKDELMVFLSTVMGMMSYGDPVTFQSGGSTTRGSAASSNATTRSNANATRGSTTRR